MFGGCMKINIFRKKAFAFLINIMLIAALFAGCAAIATKGKVKKEDNKAEKKMAADLYLEGKMAETREDWSQSIAAYSEALQYDPESDEIVKEGSHENPTFSLWEVSRIYAPFVLFEPRHVQVYRTQIKTFTTLEWKQLVDANGDFSVLGVPLTKDNHIGDFNLAFRNNDYDELAPPRQ